MTLIVDEVMLREPNLLVPGKKPVGPVKIDWSHSLANGLNAYFILNSNQPQDLVTGQTGTLNSGASYAPKSNGMTLDIRYFQADSLSFPYHPNYNIANLDGFTFLENVYQPTNRIANLYIFAPSGSSPTVDGTNLQQILSTKYMRWQYKEGTTTKYVQSTVPIWPTDINIDVFYGLRWINGTGYKYWVNNVTDIPITTDQIGSFDTSEPFRIGNISSTFECGHYWLGLWKRSLTDAEVLSIKSDPYQFLIPA